MTATVSFHAVGQGSATFWRERARQLIGALQEGQNIKINAPTSFAIKPGQRRVPLQYNIKRDVLRGHSSAEK